MAIIGGAPRAYAEPVQQEEAPIPFSPTKPSFRPISEGDYQFLKGLFLKFCEDNEGPWELSWKLLEGFCRKHEIALDGGTKSDFNSIWLRMATELCPVDLIVPPDFNPMQRIRDVDDNPNTIFAIGHGPFLGKEVRILRLSSVAIAVLLRLAS